MADTGDQFKKVSVKEPVKRDIAIIAGAEGRHEYQVVADAMRLYKAVALKGGTKRPRNLKNVPVAEIIGGH